MGAGRGDGKYRKLEDRYEGYDVYDLDGDKIGSVDTTYVDEANQREYVAVSGGLSGLLPGTSGSNFIPIDICTVDNNRKAIEASTDKDAIKNSPSLSGNTDFTPEFEGQLRSYYGL